jgi:hypothetical protein
LDFSGAMTIGTDPELHALKSAGARMADTLNAAIIANARTATGRWLAFALEDGSSDKVIYDTRLDAITHHQNKPGAMWFEQLRPAGYSADECAMTLQYARAMYSAGWRNDPAYPAPIMPVRREDAAKKQTQLNRHARRAAAAGPRR